MACANTISIFDVDQITIRWAADSNCYHVIFSGKSGCDRITISAWRDHGDAPPPELVIEAAPDLSKGEGERITINAWRIEQED
jgi:hypothetical protein